jgi:hypothetical protein
MVVEHDVVLSDDVSVVVVGVVEFCADVPGPEPSSTEVVR